MQSSSRKAPWKKPSPKKGVSKKMTAGQKGEARARAKKAGRPYPNLVDNMAVSRKASTKKTAKKTAKKSSPRKSPAKKAASRKKAS